MAVVVRQSRTREPGVVQYSDLIPHRCNANHITDDTGHCSRLSKVYARLQCLVLSSDTKAAQKIHLVKLDGSYR